jgi:ribosomal protein S18 acetylase RimI-like enzyme
MSATLVGQTSDNGLRPVNLRTDLAQLADLLELCFGSVMDEAGRAGMREMRAISRSPSLATLYSGMDHLLGGLEMGYVWVENGEIIGNVSVSRARLPQSLGQGFIIANVATHPNFRRQGIASELVQAALGLIRQRRGQFALLQVNVGNASTDTAARLYLRSGFRQERMFTRWVRGPQPPPVKLINLPFITLRSPREWRAEMALAELVRPNARGGLGWLRPVHPSSFRRGPLAVLGDWLNARHIERWIIRDEHSRDLLASMRALIPFSGAYQLDLLVRPAWQGRLEEPLLNYALRRLDGRYKAVVLEHPADDTLAANVLKRYGFEARATLIHMRRDL